MLSSAAIATAAALGMTTNGGQESDFDINELVHRLQILTRVDYVSSFLLSHIVNNEELVTRRMPKICSCKSNKTWKITSTRITLWAASTRCTRTLAWRAGRVWEGTRSTWTRAAETPQTPRSQHGRGRSPSRKARWWRSGRMQAGSNRPHRPRCSVSSTTSTQRRLFVSPIFWCVQSRW